MILSLLSLLLLSPSVFSKGKDDLVNLPGLAFQPSFDTYSGYLAANADATWKMHYVLMESKRDAAKDPLLIWLNGGPGCSSFGGLFEELGPFYIDYDASTLFENVYSWNTNANVLALESPIGVGFSYDTKVANHTQADDMTSAKQNLAALVDFFTNVQPQYANRSFFLSGESYAGIYIPMLSQLLVQGINDGSFPNKNFQGAAIGNGFMHVQYLMNSLVIWSAYHGRISQDEWDRAKNVCQTGTETDHDKYNYQQFMISSNGMDYDADTTTECGQIIQQLITDSPAGDAVDFDQYNYYQDCYEMGGASSSSKRNERSRRRKREMGGYESIDKNMANLINYDSTDNQWGYPCWNDKPVKAYLNKKEVQDALHIDAAWRNYGIPWADCNDPLYDLYKLTYNTTNNFFNYVLANTKSDFRFLIYNGDVDTVCNYLGDSWFIRDVARDNKLTPSDRKPWLFANQLAGFNQNYAGSSANGNRVTIDVLTVKGAGHFVPNDRPGPSLQMISNFMFPQNKNGAIDYSSTAVVSPQPKMSPLVPNPTKASPSPFSLLPLAITALLAYLFV